MDRGASVIAKLKNKAKKTGRPLQLYLQLFCQEEFLRRLACSPYADDLILKGGLFIYTLTNFESRSTVDVDFLIKGHANDLETISEIVSEILAQDTGNDFISFTTESYRFISPQRKYHGISLQMSGQIKNTRTPFNVDIGFGDVVVPSPQKRTLPLQLKGFKAPSIMTYSIESTIAEKFDAMLQRLELTSRMKDFYDIYYLANTFNIDGSHLQLAIIGSLKTRGTAFDHNSLNRVLAIAIDSNIQVRWRQFFRRTGLPTIALETVMEAIDAFLRPIWTAISFEDEFSGIWDPEGHVWNKF